MRDDSINRFLSEMNDGAVFCISDIPAGGSSHDSVKTRLSRACASGKIRRITRGIYHKPRYAVSDLGLFVTEIRSIS